MPVSDPIHSRWYPEADAPIQQRITNYPLGTAGRIRHFSRTNRWTIMTPRAPADENDKANQRQIMTRDVSST